MSEEVSVEPVVVAEANTDTALDTAISEGPAIPEKFGGDVSKLVESYNSLESKLGTMYSVPSADSSMEKWDEFSQRVASTGKFISRPDSSDNEAMNKFYNELGRPESSDKYDIKISEELQPYVDNNVLTSYQQVAHQTGMTNDQAQALVDFEVQRMNQQAEQSLQHRQAGEQQLRQSWGSDYDNRLAGAKSAAAVYSEKYPDAVNELLNGPSGNNPALIAMLSELGHSLRESGHVGTSSAPQYGMSSDDAKDKIREILDNKSHPYRIAHDPGHTAAVEKVKKLYAIAYPGD